MASDYSGEESDSPVALNVARQVACALLGLAFALGVPGNLTVVWTVCRRMSAPPPTVLLIVNLAAADLLTLLTVPFWIHALAGPWSLGPFVCQGLVWLVNASMYSGVLLITLLSAERLVALARPFHLQRWWRRAGARRVLALLWVTALALAVPATLTADTDACLQRQFSSGRQLVTLLLLETLAGFVGPFTVTAVCSACVRSRLRRLRHPGRQRAGRIVTAVVLVFAACWLPYHLSNAAAVAAELLAAPPAEPAGWLHSAAHVGHNVSAPLVFLSSCINPLLYAFAARRIARAGGLAGLFARMVPDFYSEGAQHGDSRTARENTSGQPLDSAE
ncbi:leukotriene B4 receptor 1-like [Sarcophilus harrisii]|uniref:G-protein coupled receptors family 1 profile domain-containing protein n=1 Tax=Sarcophilus harrisii TaxID=9305 RepID=A0A7N4P4I6_SARHA|nr:leukotriene B4 receptor 1-like [Sarcophilus harrisii]